jgi:hypothetical protein
MIGRHGRSSSLAMRCNRRTPELAPSTSAQAKPLSDLTGHSVVFSALASRFSSSSRSPSRRLRPLLVTASSRPTSPSSSLDWLNFVAFSEKLHVHPALALFSLLTIHPHWRLRYRRRRGGDQAARSFRQVHGETGCKGVAGGEMLVE